MSNITISNKAQLGQEPSLFKSRWDTTQAGSANDTVVLPLVSDGSYNFDVDWGDGNRDNITTYNQSEVTHQYSNTGIYEIRIKGDITGWQFSNGGDDDKIIEISKWGPLRFVSNDGNLFYGCSNLVLTATDSLTLGTSNAVNMFYTCLNLGSEGNMNSWDTSSVTNFTNIFRGSNSTFNQDVSNWDTSSATTMDRMFDGYPNGNNFNNGGSTGINNWDTSNVTDMNRVFQSCKKFNQPIGNWNTSKVTRMDYMIYDNTGFNQPIGNWDVGKVTNFHNFLALSTAFDQDLSNWNVSGVTNMAGMFLRTNFNNGGQTGINNWDTSSVTNMSNMFDRTLFNQPIGNWDTSSVTTMRYMFNTEGFGASGQFDQDIGAWDVSNVTTMLRMFNGYSIGNRFNNGGSSSISGWDTSNVTNMDRVFQSCPLFNQPIGSWNISSVTDIQSMLRDCDQFDQDLSNWNVTAITNANSFMTSSNGLSTTNYDRTLSGWSSQSVNNGVNIHFGGSQYSTATGAAYRATLVSKGWTITDGGSV